MHFMDKDKKKKKHGYEAPAEEVPASGTGEDTDRRAFDQSQIQEMGTVNLTKGPHAIHCSPSSARSRVTWRRPRARKPPNMSM